MKIVNKKAQYDYFLTNSLEVGLVLYGTEVKSILNGNCNLKGSYVKIINNEVWLINANISEMLINSFENIDEIRPRKLLLHKKQINKFKKLLETSGTTLILYEIYIDKNGRLKGTLCLGKGKQLFDKRNVIKERDLERYEGY